MHGHATYDIVWRTPTDCLQLCIDEATCPCIKLDGCIMWNTHNRAYSTRLEAVGYLYTSCLLPAFDEA